MPSESRDRTSPKHDPAWWDRFKSLLDEQTDWPASYLFKFIVPRAGLESIKAIFEGHSIVVRASSKGNYVSVSANVPMASSDEVISVYEAASSVEGVVSL